MKHYYLELTTYLTKNKAHEELQQFVLQYHQNLVDSKELAETKVSIKKKLKEVNEKYPRCHDLVLSGWKYQSESIAVDGNFILSFCPIKTYRLVEPIPGTDYMKV
ncbi:hypothetical protein [Draconibacterium orientale]|uniref:hypothetical protein n=1 Tax=Draconibacterium orientale TaxID=1168034 RepID=UPI0029C0FC87|nr:hypothetical protein [Draconibacterium orientale]